MKRRKILFKLLPIVLTLVIAAGFIVFRNNDPTVDDPTIKEENEDFVKRKLYLLSNDNMIVPVTISFEKKAGLADELYYVISLLKEDSKINDNLKGVINKDASITELTIQNKVLTIGFSKEFLNYSIKNELRIIESLVWTMSQYDEIDAININVDGKLLTKMPLGKTPLPKDMTKDIGINNHIFPGLLNAKRVVTYYTKTIGEQEMFVPVSNNLMEDTVSVFLDLSMQKVPVIYGLKPLDDLKNAEIVSVNEDEQNISFELTTSCLIEEDLVDYDVYYSLQVALSSYKEDCTISITIEGEELKVDGLLDEDEQKISSVIYNEIKI
ncbi:MAG: GerMN domain-containing protein [Bacilli bacterium]|nr:GerMN domain-containing protein [Bacilli bacterium]